MKDQYIPQVSEVDVERIVHRDFPGNPDEILGLIRGVDVREKPRVVLACLKVADGDLAKLRQQLADAPGYWREIISEAEYPNYRSSTPDRDRRIEKDRLQYLAWLNRGAGEGRQP
jgi:hypothetical protein